jgi:hypothetical protein
MDSLRKKQVFWRHRAKLESMVGYRPHRHIEPIFTLTAQAALGLASSSLSKKLRRSSVPRFPAKNFKTALIDARRDLREALDALAAFSFSVLLLPSHS